jgi:hypothetical protein
MSTVITIHQICSAAGKQLRALSLLKPAPPSISTACDPLTLTVLKKVAEAGECSGAEIAGAVLSDTGTRCPADSAYHLACHLSSPLSCRFPLLKSGDVYLPEKPPAMWDAKFSITDVGRGVVQGIIPHCLVNGYQSAESKMPPIRAKSLADAIQIICAKGEGAADNIEPLLADVDFACPCILELAGGSDWTSSGKGSFICAPNVDIVGREVHVNMIPLGLDQLKALDLLGDLLEDVPGIEECEARAENFPVKWYKLVVLCKSETAARACAEGVFASPALKTRFKIAYTVSDGEGHRIHSNPQEILRGFVSSYASSGGDPLHLAKSLAQLDDGGRCQKRIKSGGGGLGPAAIWMLDSSSRNRVFALHSIKRQSRGGKGSNISPNDLKSAIAGRVRQRLVAFNHSGIVSVMDMRQVDSGDGWSHPAETLPEGFSGICAGVAPSEHKFVVIASTHGFVKKLERGEFCGGRKGTKIAMKISGGDSVTSSVGGEEEDDLILISARGQGLRFKLKQVRAMGAGAKGITGMALKDGDRLVAAACADGDKDVVLTVFLSDGGVKSLPVEEMPLQNRGGAGVKLIDAEENVMVVAAVVHKGESDLFIGTRNGKFIRFSTKEFSLSKRGGVGVAGIELESGDAVVLGGTTWVRLGQTEDNLETSDTSTSSDEPEGEPAPETVTGEPVQGQNTNNAIPDAQASEQQPQT